MGVSWAGRLAGVLDCWVAGLHVGWSLPQVSSLDPLLAVVITTQKLITISQSLLRRLHDSYRAG